MEDKLRYLFLFFGSGLFVGGVIYLRRLKKKIAGWERTSGTVVDNVSQTPMGLITDNKSFSLVYAPVVEYFVRDKRFKVTGDTYYYPAKANGTKLTVLFRPTNPSEAYIEKGYYFAAFVILALGVVFMTVGSLLCVR